VESILRLLHCAADVDVEPQKKIYDEWGRFVARADLWVVGTRRLHEYDGELHRDRDAHRTDLARERRLVEINWQRVGFTSPQLLYEGGSIIAGLDRLLGRSWDPSRLARWHALLEESVLRPAGRARATRRWKMNNDPTRKCWKHPLRGLCRMSCPSSFFAWASDHVQDDR
jgi:hypothetical protein